MKVSLKVREERRPLIRAKVPLNVLGVPSFTGVTSGDREDLALHVGTNLPAGPSVRVSYKPNNVFSPFSVIVKTGFGLWGSPNGAPVAMSAELNLNSSGSPSFSVRMKPTFGDFSLRKDSGSFKAAYEAINKSGSGDEAAAEKAKLKGLKALTSGGEPDPPRAVSADESSPASRGRHGAAVSNGDGGFVMEKVESFNNGNMDKFDSSEKSREDSARSTGSREDSGYEEQVADSEDHGGIAVMSHRVKRNLWRGVRSKGWKFNAHSSLPLGGWAVGRVRWQVQFASDLFHDVKHGLRLSDITLPSLVVDKISLESSIPRKDPTSGSDLGALGFGYDGEDGSQLGRITAMCSSIRYQLHLLHKENKMIKSTLDDWRNDMGYKRQGSKGTDRMMQEENALRLQMFDELNGKVNAGKANGDDSADGGDPSEGLQKAIMNATSNDGHGT